MKNAEKKQLAMGLFTKSSLTRKEIASQIDVTEKTLRNWIEAGSWEEMKDSHMITRPQLLQDAYNQLKAINDQIESQGGIPTKQQSDAKGVIRKEIELFSEMPIHKYVEVFEDFIDFLQRNHQDALKMFAEISNEFIAEISKSK